MRQNLSVSQRGRTLAADDRPISTSDLHGKITCCDDALVAVSAFREQLIGQSHDLVRHPDMPSMLFCHIGSTLMEGKPLHGRGQEPSPEWRFLLG